MHTFQPVLHLLTQEWHTCLITVGVLGDIASAIKKHLIPYCDRIMGQLIHNLQSPDVHRSVKPQILSCFGDIAMGIEEKFEKYIMHVLQVRSFCDGAATVVLHRHKNHPDAYIQAHIWAAAALS